MEKLKVGYLPLIKSSWKNDCMEQQRYESRTALSGLADVEIVDNDKLIQSETDARETLAKFTEARVDVVVAHFITFALGEIVPGLATQLRVPVLLWSEPEPQMTGGRIIANSFCAANMNSHALWKMQLKYSLIYGDITQAIPQFSHWFTVLSCLKWLKGMGIGSLGGRVPGFYTSNFDELPLWEKFGTKVKVITLLELVKCAENIQEKELTTATKEVTTGCLCDKISREELVRAGALLAAFRKQAGKYNLGAWAVRCWPEFSEFYGIGVCHLLGCLTDSGIPAACEGDIYGALAMLISQALTGHSAFFCDLISFDQQGDTGIFWHCGAAPMSWCKTGCQPTLGKHSIIDGGGIKGIVNEFPLRSGPVTIMRVGEQRDRGYRLLMIRGEGQETGQLVKGNPLIVRFRKNAKEVAEELVDNGFEHHYVIARGDISAKLKILAKLLDLQLLEI